MWLIFRIFINLYYKLYRALYYPISMLAKRSFGLIVLAVIGYGLIQLFSDDDPEHNQNTPAEMPTTTIQPATTFEDGNSRFASDLLPQMTPEELQYYSRIYYWVMDNQPAGKAYSWHYQNAHGSLTPAEPFKNNMGHRCRRFSEVLKVGQTQQTLDGIACQKKGGGWCKLGKTFTPVCGLTARGRGMFDWLGDLF